MRAIDTNVALRLIVRDDTEQAEIARTIFQAPVLLSLTVLQEIGWVLMSRYSFARAAAAEALIILLDMESVTVPNEDDVRWAIGRFAAGADFADMIHIVAARPAERFATFDRALASHAGAEAPLPIETLA